MLPKASLASIINDDARSKKPVFKPSRPATPLKSTAVQFGALTAFG